MHQSSICHKYKTCSIMTLLTLSLVLIPTKNLFCFKFVLWFYDLSPSISISRQEQVLGQIEEKVNSLSKPHPYLLGKRSVFGVMPDWNPAEIIGIRPKPLALSLYKELITDSIWAYQRDNYGYRNLRSFPLLVSFSGVPFIDVRVSFNSFIPTP